MKTLVKIIILQCLTFGGLILAYTQGALGAVWDADSSYLSSVILVLFMFFSSYNLLLAGALGSTAPVVISKKLSISKHFAMVFTSLGLLGTVWGLIIMMNDDLTGEDTSKIIAGLRSGMGTALYTTACGIIANVLVSLQNFTISYDIE